MPAKMLDVEYMLNVSQNLFWFTYGTLIVIQAVIEQ